MAFPRETAAQPESIGRITVIINDPTDASGEEQSLKAEIEVEMSDGSRRRREVDLTQHLSPQRLTSLATFMSDLRTKAASEILPVE